MTADDRHSCFSSFLFVVSYSRDKVGASKQISLQALPREHPLLTSKRYQQCVSTGQTQMIAFSRKVISDKVMNSKSPEHLLQSLLRVFHSAGLFSDLKHVKFTVFHYLSLSVTAYLMVFSMKNKILNSPNLLLLYWRVPAICSRRRKTGLGLRGYLTSKTVSHRNRNINKPCNIRSVLSCEVLTL